MQEQINWFFCPTASAHEKGSKCQHLYVYREKELGSYPYLFIYLFFSFVKLNLLLRISVMDTVCKCRRWFFFSKLATLKIVMFGTVFRKCGMYCLCQHPGISLYFNLHSLSLAWYILQIFPLSSFYNKIYVKFQTAYKNFVTRWATFALLQ
jgi:hypothetical protein